MSDVLKTGWEEINNMLAGGFRRGEFVTVNGLTCNYKTRFALELFNHLALHNTPVYSGATKKPLLIFVTTEDPLPVSLESPTEKDYLHNLLGIRGFHTAFHQLNLSLDSVEDLVSLIDDYRALDFSVHAVVCDSLFLLGGHATRADKAEVILKKCRKERFLFVTTGHLNSKALQLKRADPDNYLPQVTSDDYVEGGASLTGQTDLELFVAIHRDDGVDSLKVVRGKHLTSHPVDEEKLNTRLPLYPMGGLRANL